MFEMIRELVARYAVVYPGTPEYNVAVVAFPVFFAAVIALDVYLLRKENKKVTAVAK